MTVITVTTRLTHKYLMGKTKHELADWILRDNDTITKMHQAILRHGRHTSDCRYNGGFDCTCGKDDLVAEAHGWLES